jgi:hypothetical protein
LAGVEGKSVPALHNAHIQIYHMLLEYASRHRSRAPHLIPRRSATVLDMVEVASHQLTCAAELPGCTAPDVVHFHVVISSAFRAFAKGFSTENFKFLDI